MNKTETTKNKGGRPKLQLDIEQIKQLAKINCTLAEIAAVMGCSVSTIQRGYDQVIKEWKEQGKTSLRRYMWDAAKDGNVTMMIWLSKQRDLLNMHEPPQVTEIKEEAKGTFNKWYDEDNKV